jgi:hypothetical protein
MNKDMIIPAAAGYFALRLANGEIRRRPIIAWALPAGELTAFPLCAGEAPEPTYQGIECPDGESGGAKVGHGSGGMIPLRAV